MNELKCDFCRVTYQLSEQDKQLIHDSKIANSAFIKLRCGNCGIRINFDPIDSVILPLDYPKNETLGEHYLCPTWRCEGLVVEVDDFWGCGSCGHIWKSENKIKSISQNIFRKVIYRLLRL